MDYQEAKELLDSRKSYKNLALLANETRLIRERFNPETGAPVGIGNEDPNCYKEIFYITLFGSEIIRFLNEDGDIRVTDSSTFGYTTLERINRFMPSGFRIWGETIPRVGLLGFFRTPHGVAPWNPPIRTNATGSLVLQDDSERILLDMTTGQNKADQLAHKISKYVTAYLTRLFSGKLPRPEEDSTCPNCSGISIHACHHLEQGEYPAKLIEAAAERLTRSNSPTRELLRSLWRDGCLRRRRPRTRDEEAERMEMLLKYQHEPPLKYTDADLRKDGNWGTFRTLLTDYLVDSVGFERKTWNRR